MFVFLFIFLDWGGKKGSSDTVDMFSPLLPSATFKY